MSVRKLITILAAVFAALLFLSAPSQAAKPGGGNPHFIYANGVTSGTSLIVSYKEAGVGSGATINTEITATFTAVLACVNGGGNVPSDAKKRTVAIDTFDTFADTADGGGNITATHTLPAPDVSNALKCPRGQTVTLFSATWSNVVVTDTDNNVSIPVAGGPWSVTP